MYGYWFCKNIIFLLAGILFFEISCKKYDGLEVSYTAINSGTENDLYSIYFYNDSIGFAVGGKDYWQGTILKSIDGGDTWNRKLSTVGWKLRETVFTSRDTGFIVGNRKTIIKTVDGGETWSKLIPELTAEADSSKFLNFTSIAFGDSKNGIAVGGIGFDDGVVLRTTDSGNIWKDISPEVCYDCLVYGNNSELLNNSLTSVTFSTAKIAYAVGYGMILKTNDAGATWITQSSPKGGFFKDIVFITELNGFIIGFKGLGLVTENGGDKWLKNFTNNDHKYINAISSNDINLYVVGDNMIGYSKGEGETWSFS
ncbi:MAG: hypothetical protein JKX95_04780, partial [Bacteroidia bacterium]|nr:hypothetical protein [Bacteroidia bacterium]